MALSSGGNPHNKAIALLLFPLWGSCARLVFSQPEYSWGHPVGATRARFEWQADARCFASNSAALALVLTLELALALALARYHS